MFARTPKQPSNPTPTSRISTTATQSSSKDSLIVLSNPFSNDANYKKQAQLSYDKALEIMQSSFGEDIQTRPRVDFCVERFCDFGLLYEMSQWQGENITVDLGQHSAAEIVRQWVPQELNANFGLKKSDYIPFWFKQGLAMNLANDSRYAPSAFPRFDPTLFKIDPVEERKPPLERDKTRLTVDVTDLNTSTQWNSAVRKFRRINEPVVDLMAFIEVNNWYQYAGTNGLSRLLTEVNQGADFMLVYENIRDIGLNK